MSNNRNKVSAEEPLCGTQWEFYNHDNYNKELCTISYWDSVRRAVQ